MGALIYAQNPLTEVSVASNDIGFTYWDDRLPSGEVMVGDEVKRGIAWVIVQVGLKSLVIRGRCL